MIAPMTVEGVADVARPLGFTLVSRDGLAFPEGVDAARAAEQKQYALTRVSQVLFDGTVRECAAFLIGWRDIRSSMLGALHVVDAQVTRDMAGRTPCRAPYDSDRTCILDVGHEGPHAVAVRWHGKAACRAWKHPDRPSWDAYKPMEPGSSRCALDRAHQGPHSHQGPHVGAHGEVSR